MNKSTFSTNILWKKKNRTSIIAKKIIKNMLIYLISTLFTVYTFMLLIRIFGSWFPSFAQTRFMQFIAYYTDPYLNIFRKIIPPLGMIDLSPMLAFFALQILQWIFLSLVK